MIYFRNVGANQQNIRKPLFQSISLLQLENVSEMITPHGATCVGPLALTNDKIYGLSNVNGPASRPL